MKCCLALILVWGLCSGGVVAGQNEVLNSAGRLELEGRFKEAAIVLTSALQVPSLPAKERKTLEFELDRLTRIRKDFPYTKQQLFEELRGSLNGLTPVEFDAWMAEGRFDSRKIDGQRYFMASSVSNLYFRYPELTERRIGRQDSGPTEHSIWANCFAIKTAATNAHRPFVLPKRFRVTMTVTAKTNAAPPGQLVRAWLPIPRGYPYQSGFELVSSSSPVKLVAAESSPIRSVFMEQPAVASKPTMFRIEYQFTASGVWFDPKPGDVKLGPPGDPNLRVFTQEAPHVIFTPAMRKLSEEIAGQERNPLVRAKRYYDWIADNIQYSYALEYSTIRNISEYCRTKGYGDCGQEALLFITLCRLSGIPARWQSGWNLYPEVKTIHDWCEIYLQPYGWIPVDPYMGIYAMRYANTLNPGQKRELRDFYFGGLDQYRMAANSDHCQTLDPPKNSMRSDTVDFQRGELESGNQNIYFGQFSYDLQWNEVTPPRAE